MIITFIQIFILYCLFWILNIKLIATDYALTTYLIGKFCLMIPFIDWISKRLTHTNANIYRIKRNPGDFFKIISDVRNKKKIDHNYITLSKCC